MNTRRHPLLAAFAMLTITGASAWAQMGDARPRIGDPNWKTNAQGRVVPRIGNPDWTTDARGNVVPRIGNEGWTTDAQGRPVPRVGAGYWDFNEKRP